MQTLIKLEAGKPFPLRNPLGGSDGAFASITGQSFDLICWANGLSSLEVKTWRKGKLRYGVFVRDGIPFFILHFPVLDWSLDVSIDILIEKEKNRQYLEFMAGEGNAVTLYLVDGKTNILKGMRMIGLQPIVADAIKQACALQLEKYPNSAALNVSLQRLLSTYTTPDMMRSGVMVSL